MSLSLIKSISLDHVTTDTCPSLLLPVGRHSSSPYAECTDNPLKNGLDFLSPIDIQSLPPVVEDCVHEQISTQCRSRPTTEGLVSESECMTYHEIDKYSTTLAQNLRQIGIKRRENIGFCFEKSAWAIISMLGILKAGGSCVPLDPSHPPSRIRTILEAASLSTVLVEARNDLLAQIQDLTLVFVNRSFFSTTSNQQSPSQTLPFQQGSRPTDPAFILFTSGSTGSPKAVVLTHSAICSSAKYHGKAMFVGVESRVYQHAAYTFDMSIYDIFTTLILGGTVCIPSSYSRIHRIAESIQHLRANWAFFTPTLLSTLHPNEVSGLRTVLLAGEPVTQEIIDSWAAKVRLLNGYGSTEMSTCFLAHLTPSSDPRNIGTPKGVITRIVDPETLCQIMDTGAGELVVIGPVLASGYLNDCNRTNTSFLNFSSKSSEYRIYRTGDIVERNADGSYHFLGRRDTMVKIRGLRVELGEIEHHLANHSSVFHSVVLYPRHGTYNEKLTAVIQPKTSQPGDTSSSTEEMDLSFLERSLSRHLEQFLASYMIPRSWIFIQNMKMTSSGKIDRKAIAAFVAGGKDGDISLIQRQPLSSSAINEKSSALLLSEPELCLPYRPNADAASDISFLDLGLDSISLIGLSKILKKAYNVDIHVAALGMLSLQSLVSWVRSRIDDNLSSERTIGTKGPGLAERFTQLLNKIAAPSQISISATAAARPPNIFLTGATGYLGTRILESLFKSLPSQSKIIALVRASDASDGLQRLFFSLARAGVSLTAEQLEGLEIWPGDLSHPDFSLTQEQWTRLTGSISDAEDQIDVVIHNGAVVNWTMAYETLEPANVTSTITLLNCLRKMNHPAMMLYVSGGRNLEIATAKRLHPSGLDLNPASSLMDILSAVEDSGLPLCGYDVSKLLSESLFRSVFLSQHDRTREGQIQCHFRTHVIRPGYIIGASNGGHVNAEDYIWRVVASALRLPKRCQESKSSWLYLAGVNSVAERIVAPVHTLSYRNIPSQKIPHEVNITQGVTVDDFWKTVSVVFDVSLEAVEPKKWLSAVEADMRDRITAEQHPLYPILDAHRQDGGMLGTERDAECKTGSDMLALEALEQSLKFLKQNSKAFRAWVDRGL